MARYLRKAWTGRLIAATLALALFVASFVGAIAHASGHLHGHEHHHGTIAAPDGSHDADNRSAHSENHQRVAGVGAINVPGPAHQHSGCVDFACHGGLAVLATVSSWRVAAWPKTAVFPWNTRALASVSPTKLDRPPKFLASA
jgi:hypothetical protein